MADVKRYATAGGTFACIIAIGFFMQNGANAPQADTMAASSMSMQPAAPVDISEVAMASAEEPRDIAPIKVVATLPEEPLQATADLAEDVISDLAATDLAIEEKPAMAEPAIVAEISPSQPDVMADADVMADTPVATPQSDAPVVILANAPVAADSPVAMPAATDKSVEISLLDPAPATDTIVVTREEPKMVAQCDITMTAQPMAAALVKLELAAPCLPNERLTMHHNGMMFTDTTDANGKFEMAVPALAETAVFIASFANSDGAVASTKVTELVDFDRAVVQSEFENGTSLHALEYGADYNGSGHIWANAAGEIADTAVGKGGFMMMLGNPSVSDAMTAQVYTFPSAFAEQGGDVSLSVEIEVTAANCGKEIEAQTLQTVKGAPPKVQSLSLTMPDCDAIGDFLVLKNLVNDLKVASATN
jgi:hypothetical protein